MDDLEILLEITEEDMYPFCKNFSLLNIFITFFREKALGKREWASVPLGDEELYANM